MLSSVEQVFVGSDERQSPLKRLCGRLHYLKTLGKVSRLANKIIVLQSSQIKIDLICQS